MSKPAKQALVVELMAAVAPLISPTPTPLPKGITQAVEDLAESILRWQARQQRPTYSISSHRTELSAADTLAGLMEGHLYEEGEALRIDEEVSNEALAPPVPASPPTRPEQKKPRPRLVKPSPPDA